MSEYKKYKQLVQDPIMGDCYRACMATLLQLPPEILPNDFSPQWNNNWKHYLSQFGISISHDLPSHKAIWIPQKWIASVKSLNYKGGTHAIVMQGSKVFHDPSTSKRYKSGEILTKETVMTGRHLIVDDSSKLHLLNEYRQYLDKTLKEQDNE